MENMTAVWQIVLIALVAGALIGALAYRLISSSKSKTEQIRTELDETRDELAVYKASVQTHFDKTSELVNELTQNYARVYQHLAEGAHTLGNSQALNSLLEQQPGRVLIAVDDETAPDDPLADELADAQAQTSIDLPLGDGPVAVEKGAAASDTDDSQGAIDIRAGEPVATSAEQVAWEPAPSGPAAESADESTVTEEAAETPFDATQKFSVEGEAAKTVATDEVEAAGESEEEQQKSKQKEVETA